MQDRRMCSEHDIQNERDAITKVAAAYKLRGVMAPPYSKYDGTLIDDTGKTKAVVEVKFRNIEWGRYPTLHIGERQLQNCLSEAAKLQCAFLFVVPCFSGLYVVQLATAKDLERRPGGRWDREGISTDQEMMVHIPIGRFTKIC
jgi:hypothetical protein